MKRLLRGRKQKPRPAPPPGCWAMKRRGTPGRGSTESRSCITGRPRGRDSKLREQVRRRTTEAQSKYPPLCTISINTEKSQSSQNPYQNTHQITSLRSELCPLLPKGKCARPKFPPQKAREADRKSSSQPNQLSLLQGIKPPKRSSTRRRAGWRLWRKDASTIF